MTMIQTDSCTILHVI